MEKPGCEIGDLFKLKICNGTNPSWRGVILMFLKINKWSIMESDPYLKLCYCCRERPNIVLFVSFHLSSLEKLC